MARCSCLLVTAGGHWAALLQSSAHDPRGQPTWEPLALWALISGPGEDRFQARGFRRSVWASRPVEPHPAGTPSRWPCWVLLLCTYHCVDGALLLLVVTHCLSAHDPVTRLPSGWTRAPSRPGSTSAPCSVLLPGERRWVYFLEHRRLVALRRAHSFIHPSGWRASCDKH